MFVVGDRHQGSLAELDFNPVIVSAAGIEVVDARVRVAPSVPAPEERLRRMSD